MVAVRPAPGVERHQGPHRAVVGGQLQGGLQHRPGRAGPGVEELGRLPQRQPERKPGRVSPVQVQAPRRAVVPVHHRHHPGRGRPPPRHAAPAGHHPHGRVHPQARPPPGTRHRPDPLGHHPRRGGRWFVAFTCQIDRTDRAPTRPDAVAGVDLGVKALAVLSTGETIDNPNHHRAALRRLRRLSKELARRAGPRTPDGSSREASKRWHKTKVHLGKTHARVAGRRRDGLHQLTTRLAATYGTVVVEDLDVAGMLANRRLARAVADAGMAEVRRQLAYKTVWRGGRLVVADRWYPSSKTCSGCGAVKAKLALSERTYACTACGLVLDRDENAARNLAALAAGYEHDVAQSCGETVNARGAGVRPADGGRSAEKRELPPGERSRRKSRAA
ncbi:RNA-guided endonuclease TnpB family protein [Streptosporangium sp. NPDC000396]|uniref:RNA-guided endonuclease TnpB family protein n=1 Tax=Streptosporangium sp. NPDC000396 TaxID=3366185 RepID=UPI0036A5EA49